MRISGVESTDLFRGIAARPLQIIRVYLVNFGEAIAGPQDTVTVSVRGAAVSTPEPVVLTGLEPGAAVTA